MAWIQENVDTYVKTLISPTLHSDYTVSKVLLAILAGQDVQSKDRLGDPQNGVTFGGRKLGRARKASLNGSYNHEFRYQKSQVDAPSTVDRAGATPTASGFAEDNVGTAETRWNQKMGPVKLRQDTLDEARDVGGKMGKIKIADAMEEAISFTLQRMLEDKQADLWTGTLTVAQQNSRKWDNLIGVQHACDDGVADSTFINYGRVDRTVETELKGTVNAAADLVTNGHLASTKVELGLIRKIGNTSSIGGPNLKSTGAGVHDLVITTPDLWNVMADEADDESVIHRSDKMPPALAVHGFQNPIIMKDNTLVIFDTDCPSGEMYNLSTRSWLYEVQGGHNWKLAPFRKKWEHEEGGEYYQWSNLDVKDRLTCVEPGMQVKTTGLTTT